MELYNTICVQSRERSNGKPFCDGHMSISKWKWSLAKWKTGVELQNSGTELKHSRLTKLSTIKQKGK